MQVGVSTGDVTLGRRLLRHPSGGRHPALRQAAGGRSWSPTSVAPGQNRGDTSSPPPRHVEGPPRRSPVARCAGAVRSPPERLPPRSHGAVVDFAGRATGRRNRAVEGCRRRTPGLVVVSGGARHQQDPARGRCRSRVPTPAAPCSTAAPREELDVAFRPWAGRSGTSSRTPRRPGPHPRGQVGRRPGAGCYPASTPNRRGPTPTDRLASSGRSRSCSPGPATAPRWSCSTTSTGPTGPSLLLLRHLVRNLGDARVLGRHPRDAPTSAAPAARRRLLDLPA